MNDIIITVNTHSLQGNTHQPLLEQLELAGLKPEFQCRDGICGICRCKLEKGSVFQNKSIAFLEKNEILTCRSIPKASITLKFDYHL